MLQLDGVSKAFGGVQALDDLSLDVRPGEIAGLIGPNGSGKTTCVNVVSGLYRPNSGHVLLDGEDIGGRRPERIVRRGIARTFQNLRLFAEMTVLENVAVAQNAHCRALSDWLATRRLGRERARFAEARRLLERVGLAGRAGELAGNLPFGDQKRLEIARALASSPRLLLLDEPAGGMNPEEIDALTTMLRAIRDGGVTILLIEHNMSLVMSLCERIVVLNFGRLIAEGSPAQVQGDPQVIEAYLGTG